MRIVVVGAGAMGSLFAAGLARTGEEVWVYDPWREHVEAIRRDGLRVAREGAEDVVALRATTDPAEPGVADLVLVFVKHAHTRQAAADARPLLHGDTTVVTVQNGLGNVEILAAAVPPDRLLYGLTTLTSELDRLEQRELVRRTVDRRDRRARTLALTDSGERLRALVSADADRAERNALRALDDADVVRLKSMLFDLIGNTQDQGTCL